MEQPDQQQPSASESSRRGQYSAKVAAVFTVNLIVGVGSLTLSKGVNEAGVLLGPLVLCLFAFAAFITATWIVELLSTANAVKNGHYEIRESVEFLELSEMFLGPRRRFERWLLNLTLISYLYGDLAIYAVAVPLSLVRMFGEQDGGGHGDPDPPMGLYRLFVVLFAAVTVPFCFFSFQRTRVLQLITGFLRQFAIILMILLSIQWWRWSRHRSGADASAVSAASATTLSALPLARFSGLRRMVGLAAYCFMAHHSLPGIVTPIANKRRLRRVLVAAFSLVFTLYVLLAVSSNLAFGLETRDECPPAGRTAHAHFVVCKIQPLISLNFVGFAVPAIAVFLSLYLVFTLPFNLVMIAITLRNNLRAFAAGFGGPAKLLWPGHRRGLVLATCLAVLPPFALAIFTSDVEDMVSVTGMGGLFIIFLGPARLIMLARQRRPAGAPGRQLHASPFQSCVWPWLVIVLGFACLLIVLSEFVMTFFSTV